MKKWLQFFASKIKEKSNKSRLPNGILSERTQKGLGNSQQAKIANGYSFAVLAPYSKQGKDGKGMERKRKIKDGQIVVKNPLYQELPEHEITIQSGRTLYRFTGSYDGNRSLPHKVLQLIARSPIDEENKER